MSKIIATYKGKFDVYWNPRNIKIQIISVPKQGKKPKRGGGVKL
jgi:hypothetical protein